MKFNQQLVIDITKKCNLMMLVKSSSHKSISKFTYFKKNVIGLLLIKVAQKSLLKVISVLILWNIRDINKIKKFQGFI